MIVYFVRHGQAEHNVSLTMNGDPNKEVHLTELGKKQVEEAAEKLKDVDFEVIFISELVRTKETAEIINKYHDVELKVDKRINELVSGLEGKTSKEWISLVGDRYTGRVNDGESFQDIKKRVASFLDDLKGMNYKTVLVSTHQDVVSAVVGYFKKVSDEVMFDTKAKNAEIFKFEL
jgi:broad specificity phosphatase PhoE